MNPSNLMTAGPSVGNCLTLTIVACLFVSGTDAQVAFPPPIAAEQAPSRLDVIYVPTPQHIVDAMLNLARVKKEDVVYDLGCGDGRIVITAAKRYRCTALGVDIDPQRVLEAQQNAKAAGVEGLVTIEQQNIFELDLREVDVVALYLTPTLNARLIPQLEQMKPGSRIVSHDFEIPGVEPVAVTEIDDAFFGPSKIFLWGDPIKKSRVVNSSRKDTGYLRDRTAILEQPDRESISPYLIVDHRLARRGRNPWNKASSETPIWFFVTLRQIARFISPGRNQMANRVRFNVARRDCVPRNNGTGYQSTHGPHAQ